ncbi:aminoglycoside phosphotransferase family protein [Kitasatospora sp. NPDC056273]|uniref:aminoglycoside phosphotransferase family protein n=1 Tax=Kitasatospora sp. NPDC056273 TaxID=3345769 RepID=UPI0035D77E2E
MTTTVSEAIARLTGPAEVVADLSWPGTTATVRILRRPGGQHLVLKTNSHPDCFTRELHALRTWTPALETAAPQLVDADEDARVLLMTALPGIRLDLATLTTAQEQDAYRQTGQLLRRLHEAGPPQTITDFGRQRAAYLRAQLTGPTHPLTTAELDFALAAIDQLETLPPQKSQPSHLDLTARNLLADTDERGRVRIAVIDFETSRYEAAGRDFLRITQRTLRTRSDLSVAFYNGYGRQPSEDEQRLIRWCGIGDAAAIAITAAAAGHDDFAHEGHAALRASMAAA